MTRKGETHGAVVRLGGCGCLRRTSCGIGLFRCGDRNVTHDQNRRGRIADDAFRDAAQNQPREAASAVPRSTSAPRAGERRTSVTWAPARAHRAAARAGAGAAHILRLAGLPRVSGDKANRLSSVVVLTLLAVLVAILLGVGSTYVPAVRTWARL